MQLPLSLCPKLCFGTLQSTALQSLFRLSFHVSIQHSQGLQTVCMWYGFSTDSCMCPSCTTHQRAGQSCIKHPIPRIPLQTLQFQTNCSNSYVIRKYGSLMSVLIDVYNTSRNSRSSKRGFPPPFQKPHL